MQLNWEDILIKYSASNTSGYFRFSATPVSWRASLFYRKLSKEINTPPHGVLLQTFSVNILFLVSCFSCLILITVVTIWDSACQRTSFSFSLVHLGRIWLHVIIERQCGTDRASRFVIYQLCSNRKVTVLLCVPIFLTSKQGSETQHLKGSSIFKTLSS